MNDEENKFTRCGSLQAIFDKTPEIETKTKLHYGKMLQHSDIFKPDTKPAKRMRLNYEHNLDSKDPLNIKVSETKEYDLSTKKLYLFKFYII